MTIQENLELLQNTKEQIRQAILAVGGELEASAPFSAYPEAILALSGDTPEPTPEPVSVVTISSVQDPAFRVIVPTVNNGEYWMIGVDTSSAFTYSDSGSSLWNTTSRQQGVWASEDAADGADGVMHAADYETQIQQGKLSLKTLSAGTWYVKAWVSTDGTWSTASAVTAVTPVVEVVQEADPCVEDPCSSPDCPDYDAEACGGGESIPEGLHKFTIGESQWPDCAMMVEAYFNPIELSDGETASQTVNIYSDPLGEHVNSITYNGLEYGEMYVENTNYNAGVYCTSSSDWSPYESGPQAFKLECRTAGTYYIEVVGHTDPRFYDANGSQINPE